MVRTNKIILNIRNIITLIAESSLARDLVSLRAEFKALKLLSASDLLLSFRKILGEILQASGIVKAAGSSGPIGKSWSDFIAIFILLSML